MLVTSLWGEKKALYRPMNMPVPKLICVTLATSFVATVEKTHFGEKRWKCAHMSCVEGEITQNLLQNQSL